MNPPTALEFTAIDFETANRDNASVCQVGVVRVESGMVVARDSWLVIPPTGVESDDFDPGNIRIHGIFPSDVRKKGITWQQSLDRLQTFSRGTALVAHNVSFDRGAFEAACLASGIAPPALRWEDTLVIARRHLQLENYKLPTVAAHVGIRKFKHHDAAADAEACAQIAIHVANEIGASDIDDLWPVRKRSSSTAQHLYYDRASTAKSSELPQPSADADERHPLYGQMVVLTGDLDDMARWDAFEAIAAVGGIPQKGVTLKTTVLIVAGYDRIPANYNPSLGTGKERKAGEYIERRGREITFIGASDFREALAWAPAEDSYPPAVLDLEDDNPGQPEVEPVYETTSTSSEPEFSQPTESTDDELSVDGRKLQALPDPDADADADAEADAEAERVIAREPEAPVNPVRPVQATASHDPVSTYDPTPRTEYRAPERQPEPRLAPTPEPRPVPDGYESFAAPPKTPSTGGSTARKIIGWLILIPSALATLLMLLFLVIAFIQPGELAVKIGAIILLLLITFVPAALTYLGIYLIWLRDRRRAKRVESQTVVVQR